MSPEAGTGCDSGAGSKAGAEPDAGAKATGATVTGTTATGATATGTTATGATATGTTATGATSRSAGKGRRKGRGRKGVGGKGSGRKTSDSKASGGKRSGRREPRVQEDVTGGPGARGTVARKSGVRGPRFQGDVTRKSGAREPDPRGAEPQAPNTRGISRRGPILDGDSRETHGRQGPVGRKPTVLGEPIFEANILVAEDNPFNQKVAVLMLEMLGCRVDIAQSGTEAVRLFASAPYDLVFMDCQMPEMDGYETTAAILELEQGGTHTPIIAMTAHAMKGARQECLKAGMDDYLSKPVTIEALRALLRRWLVPEEVEGDAPPTQPTPACEQSADEQRADAAPANEVRSVKDPAAADEAKQTGETRAADDEPLPANDAQPVDEEPLADEPQPTDEAQAADEAQAVPVLSD